MPIDIEDARGFTIEQATWLQCLLKLQVEVYQTLITYLLP